MYRPWKEDSSAMLEILALIPVVQSKRYSLEVGCLNLWKKRFLFLRVD